MKGTDLTDKFNMPIILVTDRREIPSPILLHVERSVLVDTNIVNGSFYHPGLIITEAWQPILYNLEHRQWVATMDDGVKKPARTFIQFQSASLQKKLVIVGW